MRKELLNKMVENYYKQLRIVQSKPITLRQYLEAIQKSKHSRLTNKEVEYGVSLEK